MNVSKSSGQVIYMLLLMAYWSPRYLKKKKNFLILLRIMIRSTKLLFHLWSLLEFLLIFSEFREKRQAVGCWPIAKRNWLLLLFSNKNMQFKNHFKRLWQLKGRDYCYFSVKMYRGKNILRFFNITTSNPKYIHLE